MLDCSSRNAAEHGSALQRKAVEQARRHSNATTGNARSPAAPPHAACRGRLLRRRSGNSPCPACPARTGRRCSPVATNPAVARRHARSARGHLPTDREVVAARRECRVYLAATNKTRSDTRSADAVTTVDAARRQTQDQWRHRSRVFRGRLGAVCLRNRGRAGHHRCGRTRHLCGGQGRLLGYRRRQFRWQPTQQDPWAVVAAQFDPAAVQQPQSKPAMHQQYHQPRRHPRQLRRIGPRQRDCSHRQSVHAGTGGAAWRVARKFRWHRCRLKPSPRAAIGPWQNRAIRRYPCCRCRRSPLPHRP